MGILDWIILGFLLLFAILGWRKGVAAALIQLCAYVATFFLAGHYFPLVQRSLLIKYHLARGIATVISIVLILVLVAVVVKLTIYACNRLIFAVKLSNINKAIGAALGFGNGLLVIIIFMVMLDFVPSISTPLKNGETHRVYAGIDVLKEDLFSKLKLTERMKLIKLPKINKTIYAVPEDTRNK
ncbi:MAG: CvpA family protein [Candidatus Cloacimonetes bacterium]|nr:CvpA family protein [Candidatus Cloacimonadota bacterium]